MSKWICHVHTVKMRARTIASQGILANRAICRSTTYVGGYRVQWRRYSTPAPGVLPLEGIRVLDMTRVLAGVSFNASVSIVSLTDTFPALLYTNTRRFGVWILIERYLCFLLSNKL
jgi:hypothetical protein